MRIAPRFVVLPVVTFVLLVWSNAALAQCAFDGPYKAIGMRAALVRVFAGCPSITFPFPTSQTGTGVPTCAPPYAYSTYDFDPSQSRCTFKALSKIYSDSPCIGGPCNVTAMTLECIGVMNAGGQTPAHVQGFTLDLLLRVTMDDADNGDMTVVDLPLHLELKTQGGKLTFGSKPELLVLDAGLPACSSVEFLRVGIKDPDGNPFAVWGAGTRPRD